MLESSVRQRERQEARRKAGLCYKCGKNPPGDKGTKCSACRARDKRTAALRSKKNKAKGLCVSCKKKLSEDEGTLCATCRKRNKRADVKLRKQRTDNGLCVNCGRVPEPDSTQCERCSVRDRRCRQKLRDTVFERYGGYTCVCCGETQKEFLQIDHVNNDGAAHRREIGGSSRLYRWLKRNDFPPGFQVLCRICNGAKGHDGCCPHQYDLHELQPDEVRARLDAIDAKVTALDTEAKALQERL